MRRNEITPHHVETILTMFASAILGTAYLERVIANEDEEYPLIWRLLFRSPESLIKTFQSGSLMHDFQRVGGIEWSWRVSEDTTGLKIFFYKNKAKNEVLSDELNQKIEQLNQDVAVFLADQNKKSS